MKWTRHRAAAGGPVSAYTSGPYRIDRIIRPGSVDPVWWAIGPGLSNADFDRLADAKAAAERVARCRVADPACRARVGDVVNVGDRRGAVTAIMAGAPPARRGDIHVITFSRGRKLCLHRDEFEVVLP